MTEPMPASSAPRAGARLTPSQRIDRATTGAELQRLVTDLATLLGWEWVHFRPAQTTRGWRTPVEGPLGQGWPDLLLTKPGRILAVELKRQLGDELTVHQRFVLDSLSRAGMETYVFRPSDLSDGTIEAVLRGGKP